MTELGLLKRANGEPVCPVRYAWTRDTDGVEGFDLGDRVGAVVDEWLREGGPHDLLLWPEMVLSADDQKDLVLETGDERCFALSITSNPFTEPLLAHGTERKCEWFE